MTFKQIISLTALMVFSMSAFPATLSDPTRPGGGVQNSPKPSVSSAPRQQRVRPHLHFEGLSIIGEYRAAIINGRHLTPGDQIAGAKLVSISNDYVTMSFNGDAYRLNRSGRRTSITVQEKPQQEKASTP